MNETRWTSTLKMVLIILAVIAAALLLTHADEAGAWIAENLMGGAQSDLRQILE